MPVSRNFYDFFGIDHNLDLNVQDLEKRFYQLSRQWHPDVFARKSGAEQAEALDASAILNDAYRTLRDPIRRAEYLLKENGFDNGEQKSANVPPELLEEVFEFNEAREEADEAKLAELNIKFHALRDEIDRDLQRKFTAYDLTRSHDVLVQIRGLLNRRKYIHNLTLTHVQH